MPYFFQLQIQQQHSAGEAKKWGNRLWNNVWNVAQEDLEFECDPFFRPPFYIYLQNNLTAANSYSSDSLNEKLHLLTMGKRCGRGGRMWETFICTQSQVSFKKKNFLKVADTSWETRGRFCFATAEQLIPIVKPDVQSPPHTHTFIVGYQKYLLLKESSTVTAYLMCLEGKDIFIWKGKTLWGKLPDSSDQFLPGATGKRIVLYAAWPALKQTQILS